MYRIVAAVDTSETYGKRIAETIAGLPGGSGSIEVLVLHCFEENPSGASATQIAAVRRCTERLDEADIDYEVREDSGEPAAAITSLAVEADADLIVIGGRKRTPTGKALFGSVTQEVILEADRSVMVVGGKESGRA